MLQSTSPTIGSKAVRAALGMRETLARLNADDAFGFGSQQKVGIGIGIHTGLACVGNMGAETRFNYSAVGDAVNIAARIESACKEVGFDILVSEATATSLTRHAMLDAGALSLKGKSGRTRFLRSLATNGSQHRQNLPSCSLFTGNLSKPLARDRPPAEKSSALRN